jgi:RNA methyltransferase, TrmH family
MFSKVRARFIRSLHDKKTRSIEQRFLVEGEKIVAELLQSSYAVESVYYQEDCVADVLALCAAKRVENEQISNKEMEQISALQSPSPVIAVVHMPEQEVLASLSSDLYLALDGIRDPGNLGTLIRTAEWFGIQQVFCSEDCVELYNPKVLQASMGSFLRVKVQHADLKSLFEAQKHIPVYAAVMNGENLYQMSIPTSAFILIGSESHGVSQELQEAAAYRFTIPRYGQAESLNAAIAGALSMAIFRKQ